MSRTTARGQAAKSGPVTRPFRRVTFTCDLLRFSLEPQGYRNAQAGNLRWLCSVLGALTEWPRWGVDVRCIEPPTTREELVLHLRSPQVLDAYQADPLQAWAQRYDGASLDVRPAFAKEIRDCDLVIGFELPPALKRVIHEQGKPYISFHIHALRFLSDLCLGASTNDPHVQALLESVALPEAQAGLQARRYAAQLNKHAFAALHIPDGWPLLIGQTAKDSILIENGRFADWPDFEDSLADLLAPYPGCVLLEHPFRSDTATVAQFLRARFGKPVVMSNANGYGIVFQSRHIPRAITLSSSLGFEAQCAGVPTTYLLGDPRQRLQLANVDVGTQAALHHGVLNPSFWQELLGIEKPMASVRKTEGAPFDLGDSFLRRGIESWSYAQLQAGFAKARSRKVVFPTEALSSVALQQLMENLAGADEPVQGWDSYTDGQHQDRGVDLVLAPAAVAVGEHLKLIGADPWSSLLLRGFHAPEPWGAWTAQREAQVGVFVTKTTATAGAVLCVTLTLQVFEGLRSRCPVCRIAQDDVTLAWVFFRPGGPPSIDVTFSMHARSAVCVFDLVLSDIDSPFNTLGAQDTRQLGIGLLAISVSAEPVGAPLPGRAIWGVTAQPCALEAMTEPGG